MLDLEPARNRAITQLKTEYESAACAVCGTDKWPNFPFCRTCSIKLQRAGLMKELVGPSGWMVGEYGVQAQAWGFFDRSKYVKSYDRCRDFLMVAKRIPMQRKIQDLD